MPSAHLAAGEEVVVQEAVHVGGKEVRKVAVEDAKLAQEQRYAPLPRHTEQPSQHSPGVHTKVVPTHKVCKGGQEESAVGQGRRPMLESRDKHTAVDTVGVLEPRWKGQVARELAPKEGGGAY